MVRIVAGATGMALMALVFVPPAVAAETLDVTLEGLTDGVLPDEVAFCIPDPERRQIEGDNVSPAISWSAGPRGRSPTPSSWSIRTSPPAPRWSSSTRKA